MTLKELGRIVRTLRKRNKITGPQLYAKGVHPRTTANIELGRGNFEMRTLCTYLKLCNITFDEIASEYELMKISEQ